MTETNIPADQEIQLDHVKILYFKTDMPDKNTRENLINFLKERGEKDIMMIWDSNGEGLELLDEKEMNAAGWYRKPKADEKP